MAKKGSTAYVGINANTKGFEMGLRRLTRGFRRTNRAGGAFATNGVRRGMSGLGRLGVAGLGLAGVGFGATQLIQTFARMSPEFNKAFVATTSALRDTIRPHIEEFGRYLIENLPAIKKAISGFAQVIVDAVEYWGSFSWDQLFSDLGFVKDYWVDAGKDLYRGFREAGAQKIADFLGPEAVRDLAVGAAKGGAAVGPDASMPWFVTAWMVNAGREALHNHTEGGSSL